ncbi:MAG: hypothetical protein ACPGUD_08805 [Parashewanella sp.]
MSPSFNLIFSAISLGNVLYLLAWLCALSFGSPWQELIGISYNSAYYELMGNSLIQTSAINNVLVLSILFLYSLTAAGIQTNLFGSLYVNGFASLFYLVSFYDQSPQIINASTNLPLTNYILYFYLVMSCLYVLGLIQRYRYLRSVDGFIVQFIWQKNQPTPNYQSWITEDLLSREYERLFASDHKNFHKRAKKLTIAYGGDLNCISVTGVRV